MEKRSEEGDNAREEETRRGVEKEWRGVKTREGGEEKRSSIAG